MAINTGIRKIQTDLAIIGTGLAGTAASVFAINRGIECSLAGNTGALAYTTGYLDLLGFTQGHFISTPWEALNELNDTDSKHPFTKLSEHQIREAFSQFCAFVSEHGAGYTGPSDNNLLAITPAGTVKPTLCVPLTTKKGIDGFKAKTGCTIIGFRGLKGFSAHQIVANLKAKWPGLTPAYAQFPGHLQGELYAEVAARSLEVSENQEKLAQLIVDEAAGNSLVGLPAILGMHNPDDVMLQLENMTGLSLFEIPTMPPSVAGIRLREMFEQILPKKNVHLVPQQKVKKIDFESERVELTLSDSHGEINISARSVLLATGRFLSGGLYAHFDHVAEPLIGLPVTQPSSRDQWYQQEYLDSSGHQIHLAGIETNELLQPLDKNGKVYDPRLFSAGIILAHQDWIRQRCGAGVAIGTAYKAIQAIEEFLHK